MLHNTHQQQGEQSQQQQRQEPEKKQQYSQEQQQQASYNRRPHQKSRYGCRQCKQRKVKCDEKKPACSHCVRYSVECIYLLQPPRRKAPQGGSGSRNTGQRPVQPFTTNDTPSPASSLTSTPGEPPSRFEGPSAVLPLFSLLDMELLHHFTCFTSRTLSNKPERQKARQEVMPQLSFEHDFLMHGILSLAAMHLAHDQPHRREELLLEASRRQDLGLIGFRRQMQTINKYNCHALFAFSSILVIATWASSRTLDIFFFRSTTTSINEKHPDWMPDGMAFVRGVGVILDSAWDWISKGPMSMFLKFLQEGMILPRLPNDVEELFKQLERLWTSEKCTLNEIEVAGLQKAHEFLRDTYIYVLVPDKDLCKVSTMHFWLTRISASFTDMVTQKKPEALILLAYYCVLLDGIRDNWWMGDKGVHLLKTIHDMLDPCWRAWIEWPMGVLGLRI